MLRQDDAPVECFSTSVYLAVFQKFTEIQNIQGNRIVMLNCNRIRDDQNHNLVKVEVFDLLNDPCKPLNETSFHAVSFLSIGVHSIVVQIGLHTEVVLMHWQLGNHFVLVVYYVKQRQIHVYDSLTPVGGREEFFEVRYR